MGVCTGPVHKPKQDQLASLTTLGWPPAGVSVQGHFLRPTLADRLRLGGGETSPADRLLERRGRNIGGSAGFCTRTMYVQHPQTTFLERRGGKYWWVSGCFSTRTMYVQHPLIAFWRGGGEKRAKKWSVCKHPSGALQTKNHNFSDPQQTKTKNHNFPDPPNHQPIPPHKPNLMKSKMYQKKCNICLSSENPLGQLKGFPQLISEITIPQHMLLMYRHKPQGIVCQAFLKLKPTGKTLWSRLGEALNLLHPKSR